MIDKYITFAVARDYVHTATIRIQFDFKGDAPTEEEISDAREEALDKISDTQLDIKEDVPGSDYAEYDGHGGE